MSSSLPSPRLESTAAAGLQLATFNCVASKSVRRPWEETRVPSLYVFRFLGPRLA